MLYKLLILVLLQVVDTLAPNREAVIAELLSLDIYEVRVAELRAYRDYKAAKKAAKQNKTKACKPSTNGTSTVKIECHTKIQISAVAKSSKEHIVAVLRKPHTTGANRVRLSRLKENSKNSTTKAESVVKGRNQYSCGECNEKHRSHTHTTPKASAAPAAIELPKGERAASAAPNMKPKVDGSHALEARNVQGTRCGLTPALAKPGTYATLTAHGNAEAPMVALFIFPTLMLKFVKLTIC
ncbi:unnamed protein product [Cylicocyclus nassatus]|uniref:Variant surface glycoprotein 1125 n=1 Tax=Cylicocyclus nassatus TaxID=53992 RepID=A0AA36M278_CYLNA|nr:unnamed protein product [Cylicocyclus nassatus]